MTTAADAIACKSPAEIERPGHSRVDPGDQIVINPEHHD